MPLRLVCEKLCTSLLLNQLLEMVLPVYTFVCQVVGSLVKDTILHLIFLVPHRQCFLECVVDLVDGDVELLYKSS